MNQRGQLVGRNSDRDIPASAIRLLKLFIDGEASTLLGKEWDGHIFKKAM